MIVGFVILFLSFLFSIVWLWVGGIDYMSKNHPDYKGEDFLNWDKETTDKDNTRK